MAVALVMTLAQCKKAETPSTNDNEGEKVHITLEVDNGSKNFVHPETGNAFFTNGDKVLVANNGRYVGTLVYNSSNRHFSGDIEGAVDSDYLHFYFMGNQPLAEGTPGNSTTSFTVSISDQTNCYPQIAYNHSTAFYSESVTSYKAQLLNQCALVKFTTSNEILVGAAVTLSGLNNQVSVNLGSKEFTFSQVGGGNIKLHSESTTSHWAILLPGDAATVTASATGYKTTTGISIPPVSANDYLTDGASFTLTAQFVDLGLPSGLLWATCNVGVNTPEGYGNYFAWGEIQQKNTYNWNTYKYCVGDGYSLTKYCDNSYFGDNGFTDNLTTLLPGDDAATANWGDGWRMPTKAEFKELLDNTDHLDALTSQNGVYGLRFTASNGNSLFLPAAGYRDNTDLDYPVDRCYYWTSSLDTEDQPNFAWGYFYSSTQSMWGGGSISEHKTSIENRNVGFTVRPVCTLRKN